MKLNYSVAFFLAFFVIHKVKGGAIKAPLSIITLDDVTNEERQALEVIGEQYERTKRSGSGSPDILSSLKYILAQGAKAKLRLLGRASAAASSSIASASSGSKSYASHDYTYHHPPEEESGSSAANINDLQTLTEVERIDRASKPPTADPWSSKKSVLNTLLQAVKAIKGGVLALKGQLIKGGGYLLVGGGNLVKAKGEVISNLGQKIAKSAFRSMHPDHSSEVHEDVSYGHYHPIGLEYGPPSGPVHVDHDHFHHDYHEGYPDQSSGVQSGILILKKVPSGKTLHSLHGSATNVAPIAAVEPEPHFGSIVGKLLSAASSLNPDSPAPFTHYKHPHPQPHTGDEDDHSESGNQHVHGNFDSDFELEPAFDSPEANKVVEPEKLEEMTLGPNSFKDENPSDNLGPPLKPISVDQGLPFVSVNDFHNELKDSHENSQFSSTIHVNNDFIQQPPSHNPHPGFAHVNQPDEFQFDATLNGGHFAEPPNNNQKFPSFNTQPLIDDTSYITHSTHHLNGPNALDLNFAVPLPDQQIEFHKDVHSSVESNHILPSINKSYGKNIFDHNLAEPPKSLLHYDGSQDLRPPEFGYFEQPPFNFDQRSSTGKVKVDKDFNNFVELKYKNTLRVEGKPKPYSTPSSRKLPKSYDKYRGVIRNTPIVNPHIINPSSNLDLPNFSPHLKKFNPKENSLPKYPIYNERPLSLPTEPSHALSPPPNFKYKPFTSSKPSISTSQLFVEQQHPTRSRFHPRPNFDIVQSVTYQLGPNGPKMI